MKKISIQRGFTLLEIILVMALLGIIATTIMTLIDPVLQFKKSNDAKRKSDLRQVQAALELYRADEGAYPVSGSFPPLPLLTCGAPLASATTTYLQKVPCDPRNNGNLIYRYGSDGTTYTLRTCLENVNDVDKDGTNATYVSGASTIYYCDSLGKASWSYTLTNP